MVFFVRIHLQWPGIDHFFACRIGESAVSESDDADDDEYDTDDTDRFHRCEVTRDAGLESD